jgi:hypothetical protein
MLSLLVRNGAGFTLKPRVRRARKYKSRHHAQVPRQREIRDFQREIPSGNAIFAEGNGGKSGRRALTVGAADERG